MPPLSLGGRSQLLFPPASSLTHPPLGGAKGRAKGRGIPLPARARVRTRKLSPCDGKARGGERGQGALLPPQAPPPWDGPGSPVPSACRRTGRGGRASAPGREGTGGEPISRRDRRCGASVAAGAAPAPARSRARARPRRPLRRALQQRACGRRAGPWGSGGRAGAAPGARPGPHRHRHRHRPGRPPRADPQPHGWRQARQRDIGYLFRVAQACVLGGVQQKEHANCQNFKKYLYTVAHTGITESQEQLD